jgi:hypothetical protein
LLARSCDRLHHSALCRRTTVFELRKIVEDHCSHDFYQNVLFYRYVRFASLPASYLSLSSAKESKVSHASRHETPRNQTVQFDRCIASTHLRLALVLALRLLRRSSPTRDSGRTRMKIHQDRTHEQVICFQLRCQTLRVGTCCDNDMPSACRCLL